LIWLLVFVAVLGSTWYYRQELKRRALWVYWGHRAAAHQMPAGIEPVVEDPATAATLLASNPDYISAAAVGWPTNSAKAFYVPLAWRRFSELDPRCVWHTPLQFMGTLTRPDGQRRMVVVASHDLNALDVTYDLGTMVIPVPGLWERMPTGRWAVPRAWSGPWRQARLQGGVVDPADPSRVVFDLLINSDWSPGSTPSTQWLKTKVEMRLQNDDSLVFKMPDTPELQKLNVHVGYQPRQADGFQESSIAPTTRPLW
jgi:hypothetical protein